ncbi:MAG: FkbM family methyltransferase [Marinoscillum sp.]|uniref:FkbM family methyltransferase n=1 Tax=Marinoscillum sp. TaxID=2024838 RepID=UPI0032FD68C1
MGRLVKVLKQGLTQFTNYNRPAGWFFLSFVRVFRAGGCEFNLSRNLFPSGYYSRFLFKTYESPEIVLTKKYLIPTDSIIELGACIGVVSCISNKILEKPENHVVVEANPDLIKEIEKNRVNNDCHFSVENAIVSNRKFETFYTYNIAISGSMQKKVHNPKLILSREVQVKGLGFQELQSKYGLKFTALLMDIEGAEYTLIEENLEFLKNLRLLIIEFHPNIMQELDTEKYHVYLTELGFELVETVEKTSVYTRSI